MHATNLHTLIFMSATADTAMSGGFWRNTVSKLKHRWETQTQKQLNKNHHTRDESDESIDESEKLS